MDKKIGINKSIKSIIPIMEFGKMDEKLFVLLI
jgi:hypothetical protein